MEILGGRTGKKIKVKRHLKIHWPDDEDGGGGEWKCMSINHGYDLFSRKILK